MSLVGALLGALLMTSWGPDTGLPMQDMPPPVVPKPVVVAAPAPLPKPAVVVAPPPKPTPPPAPEPRQLGDDVYIFDEGEDPFAIEHDYIYPPDVRGIAQAVKDRDPAIQDCFQTSKTLDPSLRAGKITLKFEMIESEDGESTRIEGVRLDANPGENLMFEGCLATVFEAIPFRAPKVFSGKQEMRWPVFLK